MKLISMKHWLYLVMTAVVMGLAACDRDHPVEEVNVVTTPDKGKNNTTDMAVTGGVGRQRLWVDDDGYGYISVDSITGYLNLTDEMKLAMGSTLEFGIELSDNPDNLSSSSYKSYEMVDDRMFIVDNLFYLSEKTKYYYRTYLSTGGYGSMRVYGKTESFTTDSKDNLIKNFKLDEPRITYVGEHYVYFNSGGHLAYDTDKSKLTEQNIINGNVQGTISKSYELADLESGTTYFCCSFVTIDDKYTVLSDIVEFTTEGYNVKELAQLVTVTEDGNTFTFTSHFASKYPGKDIKYGVKKYLTTSYFKSDTKGVRVYYKDKYERFTYYIAYGSETVYATGSGSTFTATTRAMQYIATAIYDSDYKYIEWYEPKNEDYPDWDHPWAGAWHDADNAESWLRDINKYDWAVERYNECVARLKDAYSRELYKYVTEVNEVFIEIDNRSYIIKTVNNDPAVYWFTHFTFL